MIYIDLDVATSPPQGHKSKQSSLVNLRPNSHVPSSEIKVYKDLLRETHGW